MKRFKLSRKEKLLFATPLLPLLVLAWRLVSIDRFERELQELAGPQAVDCGFTTSSSYMYDPCAIAAFKAGKPFIVRLNIPPRDSGYRTKTDALVKTPQGQIYLVYYYRHRWLPKASLGQVQVTAAKIETSPKGQRLKPTNIIDETAKQTEVWW